MLGETTGRGSCTNRTCYNEKTEKPVETVTPGFRDEYPVVRIVARATNTLACILLSTALKASEKIRPRRSRAS
jgi:hypothetical protein